MKTHDVSIVNFARLVWTLAIACFFSAASASTLTPLWDSRGFIYISLDGQIEPKDPGRLLEVLSLSRAKKLPVWGIVLKSPGGNVDAGLQLAQVIRQSNLSTFVNANSTCASACFYLFAAGVNRLADPTAKVGVHSAAENGEETDKATAATIRFSRVLATLDVPDSILGKIVKTPPKSIYYLTTQDLASMGVQFTPTSASKIQNVLADAGLKQLETNNLIQDKKRARDLNQASLLELRGGNIDQAINSLSTAATLSPFDAEILGNLGYAQYLKGEYDASLGTLLIATKVQPGRAKTLQNIGLVYSELGNSQLAAEYFIAYIKASKNASSSIEVLQKWASDPSYPRRAQSALLALNSLER